MIEYVQRSCFEIMGPSGHESHGGGFGFNLVSFNIWAHQANAFRRMIVLENVHSHLTKLTKTSSLRQVRCHRPK